MNKEKLLKQILFLINNNKFYSKYFLEQGIVDVNIDNVESIYKNSPIITKKIICENLRDYLPEKFLTEKNEEELNHIFSDVSNLSGNHDRKFFANGQEWVLETTTGTTGKPFTILKTPSEKLYESKYLFDKRKGICKDADGNNGFLMLEPIDPYLKSLNYRGTDKSQMNLLVEHLLFTKPKWILCTTLLLRKLYEYCYENNIFEKIKKLNLSFIETTSQKLSDDEVKDISLNFGTTIINQYGCREVWNIAYDCPCGNLHINSKYLQVDIIDENGNVIENGDDVGEVIITSYLHKNFPFYKYYLGDLARIDRKKCDCGSLDPIIKLETGRKKHKLVNTKYFGNEVFRKVLRFIYFKHSYIELEKIKIIQSDQYKLIIYAIVGEKFRKDFERIFVEASRYAIENFKDFKIEFVYKYPFIESENALKHEIFENIIL